MKKDEKDNHSLKPSEKYCLTIDEAAQYFEIGEKKLRSIYDDQKYDGLFTTNGKKVIVIRPKFEQWLTETPVI